MILKFINTVTAIARVALSGDTAKARAEAAEARARLDNMRQSLDDAQVAIDVLSRQVAEVDNRDETYQAALMAICAGVRNPREVAAKALAAGAECGRVEMRA